jgi:hypothetical protein
MSSETKRLHRILVLWLDLQQAVRNSFDSGNIPWDSKDQKVIRLWDQITDPNNQRALEEWLYQSADGQPGDWSLKALQVCREKVQKAKN